MGVLYRLGREGEHANKYGPPARMERGAYGLTKATREIQADPVAQHHRREVLFRCRSAAMLQGTVGEVTARFLKSL